MRHSLLLTIILISISTMVSAQSNSFSVGYNKNFPLDFQNNHIIWSQYKKTFSNKLSISLRTDFHTWEFQNYGNGQEYSNQILAIIPDNNFVDEHTIVFDDIDAGVMQLPTKDQIDVEVYSNLLLGYTVPLNKWELNLGFGGGFTYHRQQGIYSAAIVQITDERLANETVLLPYSAYKRGLSPNIAAQINCGYFLTENLSINLDIFFNNQANNLITHGLNVNLKF